jgi:hypothetical protein
VLPSTYWFLLLTGFHCASKALIPTCREDKSLFWIKLPVGAWWDLLLAVQGMHPGNKVGWQISVSTTLDNTPRNVAVISSWDMGHWGSLAGSNVLLCWHRPIELLSTGWALRTKGSHLIYPSKQVTEAKIKVYSIYGYIQFYRLLYPSATWLSPPHAAWPSPHSDSSGFISILCYLYLLLYQNLGLVCSLLTTVPM